MEPLASKPPHRTSVFQERFDNSYIFPKHEPSCSSTTNSTTSDPSPIHLRRAQSDDSLLFQSTTDAPGPSSTAMIPTKFLPSRLLALVCTLLITLSLVYDTSFLTSTGQSTFGARAGVIQRPNVRKESRGLGQLLSPRANTNTDVCNRWSQQSALVNGTLYLYGGHATTEQNQQDNTWTNDFFSIDVTKSWDISSPVIKALPQPSGPPAVANGYIWNSKDTLYLYGGLYSDSPPKTPDDFSLWSYDIKSGTWTEHQDPETSAGKNAEAAGQPIQRAAEGAGISVPSLGRAWYFAGHLDQYTTPGWSNQIARVYLKSLLEFTFPGFGNDGVDSLSGGTTAGQDGVWRNITEGGVQDTAQFPNRADSAIVYVPGYGAQGILINTGGGTNVSFTQMNVIDVFDIATSTWYKQSTSGSYPTLRVNPCAVAISAPDGSSTNVYVYGGQNLIPYRNQTQFSDMWILTIPSFTWIEADTKGQSIPPARVGHTCNVWDGQIIVVGGYNTELAGGCDSGYYVFSASDLTWQTRFNALSGGNSENNTQNKQPVQADDPAALSGSNGYQVPLAVQKVIGGKEYGGATITAPAQSATAGPLATGKPITYTVTGANGAVITATSTASPGSGGGGGTNVGAIVAGVVAGCLAILAAYLGFCAWVYRRQLALYKDHVAMTQRNAAAAGPGEKSAFLASSTDDSSFGKGRSESSSGAGATTLGNSNSGYSQFPPTPLAPEGGNSIANSSTENLVGEPTFFGVLLNPRRSLRVVNRD